jgi:hypothetical protein
MDSSALKSNVCACAIPVPHVKAAHKGAARTHCVRCGLPTRIALAGPLRNLWGSSGEPQTK